MSAAERATGGSQMASSATAARSGARPRADLGGVVAEFRTRLAAGEFSPPLPGSGRTSARYSRLRQLGHGDLSVARLGEGHADALAILNEARSSVPTSASLGVWAAGPIEELRATPVRTGWQLDGRRRWCSGALALTHGLVTASAPDGDRLFLISTASTGFLPDPTSWPAVGMAGSATFDVTFDGVLAAPSAAVGEPGFYLERLGFWVGAIGVAAVWLGAAEAVAHALAVRAGDGPHALAHLGAVHARLLALSALVDRAAAEVDRLLDDDAADTAATRDELELLARSVRAEVEAGASEILERTGRATGAGPLGHDAAHARRVADLTVYLRQSHAEQDLAALGSLAVRSGRADPLRR